MSLFFPTKQLPVHHNIILVFCEIRELYKLHGLLPPTLGIIRFSTPSNRSLRSRQLSTPGLVFVHNQRETLAILLVPAQQNTVAKKRP